MIDMAVFKAYFLTNGASGHSGGLVGQALRVVCPQLDLDRGVPQLREGVGEQR